MILMVSAGIKPEIGVGGVARSLAPLGRGSPSWFGAVNSGNAALNGSAPSQLFFTA